MQPAPKNRVASSLPEISSAKTQGGNKEPKPFGISDMFRVWNCHPAIHPSLGQEAQLRETANGQRLSFAKRFDAQRQRACARIRSRYPNEMTASRWRDYIKYLSKNPCLYPPGVPNFRPTLDWALSEKRFEAYLDIKNKAKLLRAVAAVTNHYEEPTEDPGLT